MDRPLKTSTAYIWSSNTQIDKQYTVWNSVTVRLYNTVPAQTVVWNSMTGGLYSSLSTDICLEKGKTKQTKNNNNKMWRKGCTTQSRYRQHSPSTDDCLKQWIRWLDWLWFKVYFSDSSCLSPYRADSGSALTRVDPWLRPDMYRSRGLSQPMRE